MILKLNSNNSCVWCGKKTFLFKELMLITKQELKTIKISLCQEHSDKQDFQIQSLLGDLDANELEKVKNE